MCVSFIKLSRQAVVLFCKTAYIEYISVHICSYLKVQNNFQKAASVETNIIQKHKEFPTSSVSVLNVIYIAVHKSGQITCCRSYKKKIEFYFKGLVCKKCNAKICAKPGVCQLRLDFPKFAIGMKCH